MDTPQAPQYEQAYTAQSKLLLSLPSGQPSRESLRNGTLAGDATGSLAVALHDASSDSAHPHALELLMAYGAFADTDRQLRSMEQRGEHKNAVNFCVGNQVGQHDWAFLRFDSTLDKLLSVEKKRLDETTTEGLSRFASYNALAILCFLSTVALSGFGLRARLQEYVF